MDLDMILKGRRSIREFREGAAVDLALVKEMLQAVVQTPSRKSSQTARYYVVMSKEMLGKVETSYLPEFSQKNCKDASVLTVTAFIKGHSNHDNQGDPVNEVGSGWGCYDLGLHNNRLILKAKDLGLDTLIMVIRNTDALRELLDIGQDQGVVSVTAVRYRDVDPAGSGKKGLDETACFY